MLNSKLKVNQEDQFSVEAWNRINQFKKLVNVIK
jgi:hypothetical protein